MFKKIAASAAVLAIAVTALTGCSSKLSTEETCTYINDQAAEKNLKQTMAEASASLMGGDTDGFKKVMDEFSGVLNDASSKTSDKQLSEALKSVTKQNDEIAKVMAEAGSDLTAQMDKINALSSEEYEKAGEYLDKACPSMSALN